MNLRKRQMGFQAGGMESSESVEVVSEELGEGVGMNLEGMGGRAGMDLEEGSLG